MKTLSVGLKFEFPIRISPERARLILSFSIWPTNPSAADAGRHITVSVAVDSSNSSPVPNIDDVMKKLGGQTWSAVTDTFPFLRSITSSISIINASLEVGKDGSGKRVVFAFSITAQITDFQIMNSPGLVIDDGLLTVNYNDNTGWSGQI